MVGRIGPHPVYRGQWIVLTFDGRTPWVPVAMSEYLDFEERRLLAAEAQTAADFAEAQARAGGLDDAALREAYEAMRAIDPAQAERLLQMLEEVQQLSGQAREGYTSATPLTPVDRLPKLVKIDPSLPWDSQDPTRILLMEVHQWGGPVLPTRG